MAINVLCSDEENTSAPEVLKKKRRASVVVKDVVASMPGAPSPSRVSAHIEFATQQLVRRARSASTSLQLHQVTDKVPIVRKAISNVISVDLLSSIAELLLLFNKLIPRTWPVSTLQNLCI